MSCSGFCFCPLTCHTCITPSSVPLRSAAQRHNAPLSHLNANLPFKNPPSPPCARFGDDCLNLQGITDAGRTSNHGLPFSCGSEGCLINPRPSGSPGGARPQAADPALGFKCASHFHTAEPTPPPLFNRDREKETGRERGVLQPQNQHLIP